jgi:transcriptional regulator with XRE-family HTH domain
VITAAQIRAARGALGWSAELLSERSGVSLRTILRFEAAVGVPPSRSSTLLEVQAALEAGGIEFLSGDNSRGPGVRIRDPS